MHAECAALYDILEDLAGQRVQVRLTESPLTRRKASGDAVFAERPGERQALIRMIRSLAKHDRGLSMEPGLGETGHLGLF